MSVLEIKPQAGFQEKFVRTNVDFCVGGGVLNSMPLDALVATPKGYVKMRNINAGDVIYNPKGGTQIVNYVLDKGEQECVEFILEDGKRVESDLDHHWRIHYKDSNLKMEVKASFIIDKLELNNNLTSDYRKNIKEIYFPIIVGIDKDGNNIEELILIKDYVLTGKKECRCINVSGEEHEYLTYNNVVTKNCGKAQPLDSLILTPNGYVRMGDLKIGDVICDTEGGTQTIESIFPQGILDTYKITFSDNSVVECNDEHLWDVYYQRKGKKIKATLTLSEILKDKNKYYFPIVNKVYFNEKELPISPFLLGLIIINGDFKCKNKIRINTIKKELIDHLLDNHIKFNVVHLEGNDSYVVDIKDTNLINNLKKLNIMGLERNEIFIPDCYIYNSEKNRTEFLRGLFTLNGYLDKYKRVFLGVKSYKFIEGYTQIIKSFGGYVKYNTYYEDRIMTISKYNNIWAFFDCKIPYKRKRYNKLNKIKNIEVIEPKEMQCIRVSNPNRQYITNDFVVTHNTFAAVLSVAEASLDGRFRGLFLRNNLGDARSSGGILDTFKYIYKDEVDVVESGEPRVTFKNSGAKIDVTHVSEQTREKLMQRFKGRQYDFIYFDEGTGFTWETFTIIFTRNRGTANWSGKVRMTTNPEKNHWLRKFLDWYIGADGFIREDREGVVRYFYINGESVEDVVWGNTKEEVYEQCKISIDRTLAKVNGRTGNFTYRDIIKSFTFYLGKMSENKASTDNNSSYVGSVAMMGGRNSQQLLEGNWNVSPEEEKNALITSYEALSMFDNDPQVNGDKWITSDLADTGTDNFIALVWDGFHIIDIEIHSQTRPVENAETLLYLAKKHNISNSHIIFDGIRGAYINDYIPEAIPFISYRTSIGLYQRMCYNLKAECYIRVVSAIKRRYISIDPNISKKIYPHLNLKERITIQAEIVEECLVIAFREMPNGKKALLTKKEMNQKLGKGRSMDVLDPISMRFLPVLDFPYGEELEKSSKWGEYDDIETEETSSSNIYDETLWG